MSANIKNITIAEYRSFLKHHGLINKRTKGGHEIWSRKGLTRPICIQTHITPIPERIIRQGLRTLDLSQKDIIDFISNN